MHKIDPTDFGEISLCLCRIYFEMKQTITMPKQKLHLPRFQKKGRSMKMMRFGHTSYNRCT